jgi:hypothetical protein
VTIMERSRFGHTCPVCAGPFVLGEGGGGCVVCGYAVRVKPPLRSRPAVSRRMFRLRRPRQLMLPLSAA